MKNFSFAQTGFTLIELLVVVLIIGILAGIAIPQYERAVHKVQATEVMNAIQALKKGLESFSMANGGSVSDPNGITADMLEIKIPTLKRFHYSTSHGESSSDFVTMEPSSSGGFKVFINHNINVFNPSVAVKWDGAEISASCTGNKCTEYFECTEPGPGNSCASIL